jgi:hypothetical protein
MWEYFLFHVRQNSKFGVLTAVLLRIRSSGMLSLVFIVRVLGAPWQGFLRVRLLSKLLHSPTFLGSALDAKVTTGILTGYVDHSAGVGGRLPCSDVIISSRFSRKPACRHFWEIQIHLVTPWQRVLLKLGNSVVCANLKGKYCSW